MKTNENIPESYPDALQKLSRKERGELLATQKQDEIKRSTDGFKVPSQTQEKTYTVKIGKQWKCTCPDYQQQKGKCKHQWAVELKLTEKLDKNGNTLQKVAEARKHDGQNWTAYNAAQTNEQQLFRNLLSSLTNTVQNPEQGNGRPSKDLGDMVFNSALKVYTGFSLRRYESLMEDSLEDKHIEDKCAYNTISHYMQKPEMTDILHELIRKSAAPLTSVETGFAADSSGFSTSTFGKFCEHKHSEGKEVRKWVKAHIMAGTNTNIVTAVELNMGAEGDAPNFEPLLEKTAEQFNVEKVSADKAYSSREIHELVDELGAEAYIPFKENSSGKARGSQAWKKMYHKFQYEPHKFWPEYKKRNNVETSFHMIKSKFSEDVKSRKERSQINEVLLKILCHNICVVIQEIHELGLEPEFS
jgi:transposase